MEHNVPRGKICGQEGMGKVMTIETIQELCAKKTIRWTNHIVKRLLQRGIEQDDIFNALMTGEIIEQYPDDYPYPSCLVLGLILAMKKFHVVCGANESELWLITAYYPDPDEWSVDFRTRKEIKL
jgi:hypothetical protein